MKKFLLVNTDGCFLGIAQRLEEEGYKVYSYYSPSCEKCSGKAGGGMIEIVDDVYDVLNKESKEDLIILIDGNVAGDEWDFIRKLGYKVIGSSHYTEDMEHKRQEGEKLAEKIGLNLPESQSFNDFNKAMDYLKKQDPKTKLVFKGDGLEMAGGSWTHLSNTTDEMMKYLTWVQKEHESQGKKIDKFMFQHVIDGVEVDFAIWFNGDKAAPLIAVDFEQKKIHGLGAPTGCTGQIEFFLDPSKEPYYQDHLKKLLPEIKGDVAVEWAANNIVSEEDHKPYFLEWTPRFGWDSTVGELALIKDAGKKIGEFFECIAFQKPFPKDFIPYGRYSCTVRLHSFGIWAERHDIEGKPVFWDKNFDSHFWWYALKKCDEDYEITGNPVGCAVACGDTPEEAMAKVYEIINPKNNIISIPDIFYSETIGENVSKNITKLKEWGILNNDFTI